MNVAMPIVILIVVLFVLAQNGPFVNEYLSYATAQDMRRVQTIRGETISSQTGRVEGAKIT